MMKKIFRILLPFWWQILLLFAGLAIQVNANLQLPKYMSNIIDQGIVSGDMDLVWGEGLSMLLITLAGGIGMIISGFFAARIGTGFARSLRNELFTHILSFSITEIDKFNTASLITRTTNDITQVQQTLVMVLRMSLQAPIMAIGAIGMALSTAPGMTWIIALVVAVLFALVIVVMIFGMPKFRLVQKLTDRLNLVTRENLTGLRVVRAFNREQHEEEKFARANNDLTRVNLFTQRLMIVMMPIVQLAISASVLLIVWVGAHQIDAGSLAIGDMVAFIQYAMQVTMSFMFLAMAFIIVPRALVSLRRIREVINTKPSIKWPETSKSIPATSAPSLVFDKVAFSYPRAEKPVLSDISFTAKPGETTAIIGSTGSGKSTIINLITRSYDATKGSITLGDVELKDFSEDDLNARIGLVPQKAVLFSGTIEENIKLGAERATKQQVEKAAKVAEAYDFISKLDKKFKSRVSQGGKNFSGGQKQRLSIARAVCKDPSLYIFDDSFSALDYKTDLKVRQNLRATTENSITLIVAQRIGSIIHADQIIVLDAGKIVGKGTHKELLKSNKIYKEIAESQLSPEELR